MFGLPSTGVRAGVERKLEQRGVSTLARRMREEPLTYLPYRSLRNIERCLDAIERRGVPGDLIECGVALGGSAVVIGDRARGEREFHGYDVFGMIPPPSEHDGPKVHERYEVIRSGRSKGIKGEPYYGYMTDLYERVGATLATYAPDANVHLHKGVFEDTLHPTRPVAFAHIDCDWYEPVKLCLERIYPVLSPGGYMISDDYHNYDGATKAVDEFLAAHEDMRKLRVFRPDRTTNLVLQRAG